jgi:hypothetical protein
MIGRAREFHKMVGQDFPSRFLNLLKETKWLVKESKPMEFGMANERE